LLFVKAAAVLQAILYQLANQGAFVFATARTTITPLISPTDAAILKGIETLGTGAFFC
jgi:hypothetical protein